jgi:hypothetical protein
MLQSAFSYFNLRLSVVYSFRHVRVMSLIMFGFIQNRFNRWLAVDAFSTDKAIRHGLEWVVSKPNYRSLLKCFVEDEMVGFGASREEQKAFVSCIAKAESGAVVTGALFPNIASASARTSLGLWLTNACRRDLGAMPDERDKVVPITCYCNAQSRRVVARTFEALGYEDAAILSHLREVSQRGITYWSELAPFIVGPCIASCQRTLGLRDALFLPPIGSEFFYANSLGAVSVPPAGMVVVRRNALDLLSGLPVSSSIQFEFIEPQLRATGWSTRTIV